jgi:hypothetical protein
MRASAGNPDSETDVMPTANPWHAVAVVPNTPACSAAEQIRGKRFLSDEAPRIPLSECAMPLRCRCVYRHFADRRAGPRPFTRMMNRHRLRVGDEERRREPRGRRAEDR